MKTKLSKQTPFTFTPNIVFGATIGLALFVRLFLAITTKGFDTDISCFYSWATRVFEGGFSAFYAPDVFTDYPPGYIYVLYVLGAIFHYFKITYLSPTMLILIKLPNILCDIAAGALIYRIGSKKVSKGTALFLSAIYLFNPAVLINSAVWGQVDSLLVICVLLLCLFLMEGKVVPACFIFALGLLHKPQMLVFAPLLLYGIYEQDIRGLFDCRKSSHRSQNVSTSKKTSLNKLCLDALGGLAALGTFFLAMVPFGMDKVIPQYTDTLTSYPYVSVNAYNFWAYLGKNWASQEELVWGIISYKNLGSVLIVLLTLISTVIFEVMRRKKREDRYFVTGSFLMITTFMFSVRMHERYLYPAMLLLVFAYLFNRQRSFVWAYILLSIAHFLNVWHVLYHYDPSTYYDHVSTIILLSGLMVVCAAYYYVVLTKSLLGKYEVQELCPEWLKQTDYFKPKTPVASKKALPFTWVDWVLMAAITLIYAVVAFSNLGYNKAPETEYIWKANEAVTLKFAEGQNPATLCYYLRTEKELTCDWTPSADGVNYTTAQSLTMKNVFTWGKLEISTAAAPTVALTLTNTSEDGLIGELIFLDAEGAIVTPVNAEDYPELFDEADTLPETFDFLASAYFDEIYYHRTANEFIEGQPAYENTHPQLGKIFIALGALIFGTNPFGFRFMGTLFGVLMLPFMYLLGRNITRSRTIGGMVSLCFAFDFMHFTQTRIATIDVFIVFFIILMYYFMERYLSLSFYDTSLGKTLLPLGACGIAFGLGISSKWTGFYAGAGLAILFFVSLYKRYQEYQYACRNPKGYSNGIAHSHIMESFIPNTLKTIGFCVIFFVIIPLTIYVLCYIPFKDYSQDNFILRAWHNQFTMFNYHSKLEATHPYSSSWYEWPTMVRPVFYYSNKLGNGMYQGISAFGNPAVWFTALPAAVYTFYLAIVKRKAAAAFLSIGLLAQFLPWTLVSRCTFLYHYFPTVPFLMLIIGYVASQLQKHLKPKVFYTLCSLYTLAVIGLFILFYPVISGAPVSGEYVDTYLRWMNGWVLIIK